MHPFDRLREYCEQDGIRFKVEMGKTHWEILVFREPFRKVRARTLDEAVTETIRLQESGKESCGTAKGK